jgi:hypothetical protein
MHTQESTPTRTGSTQGDLDVGVADEALLVHLHAKATTTTSSSSSRRRRRSSSSRSKTAAAAAAATAAGLVTDTVPGQNGTHTINKLTRMSSRKSESDSRSRPPESDSDSQCGAEWALVRTRGRACSRGDVLAGGDVPAPCRVRTASASRRRRPPAAAPLRALHRLCTGLSCQLSFPLYTTVSMSSFTPRHPCPALHHGIRA